MAQVPPEHKTCEADSVSASIPLTTFARNPRRALRRLPADGLVLTRPGEPALRITLATPPQSTEPTQKPAEPEVLATAVGAVPVAEAAVVAAPAPAEADAVPVPEAAPAAAAREATPVPEAAPAAAPEAATGEAKPAEGTAQSATESDAPAEPEVTSEATPAERAAQSATEPDASAEPEVTSEATPEPTPPAPAPATSGMADELARSALMLLQPAALLQLVREQNPWLQSLPPAARRIALSDIETARADSDDAEALTAKVSAVLDMWRERAKPYSG